MVQERRPQNSVIGVGAGRHLFRLLCLCWAVDHDHSRLSVCVSFYLQHNLHPCWRHWPFPIQTGHQSTNLPNAYAFHFAVFYIQSMSSPSCTFTQGSGCPQEPPSIQKTHVLAMCHPSLEDASSGDEDGAHERFVRPPASSLLTATFRSVTTHGSRNKPPASGLILIAIVAEGRIGCLENQSLPSLRPGIAIDPTPCFISILLYRQVAGGHDSWGEEGRIVIDQASNAE